MILVDTSVWIDFLQQKSASHVTKLKKILDLQLPFGINTYIYQELLQGTKTSKEFNHLKSYLETQKFYPLSNEKESYANAAKRYYLCRKAGLTIRSTIDMLIVQTCIEHDLFLLHNDKDFEKIASIEKNLKLF